MGILNDRRSTTYPATHVRVDLDGLPVNVRVWVDENVPEGEVHVESSIRRGLLRSIQIGVTRGVLTIQRTEAQVHGAGAVISSGAGSVAIRGNVVGSISTGNNGSEQKPVFVPFTKREPDFIQQVAGAKSSIDLRVSPGTLDVS